METVHPLNPDGTKIVLHSLTGGADGTSPPAGLNRDLAGNFYGTTNAGGASGWGTAFKIAPLAGAVFDALEIQAHA
jgi:uncharacterized repeat protein (TIGR03803 family)